MPDDIIGLCHDHSFESAVEVCRRCGLEFCEVCVVYPFGAKKPFCKECAMSLGGVRNHVTRNAQPSRVIRQRVKIFGRLTADRRAPIRVIDTPDLVDPTIRDLLESVAEDEPRLPVTVPAGDDTAFVDSLDAGIQTEPVLPPAAVKGDPADGVAPPIDWNQPFG